MKKRILSGVLVIATLFSLATYFAPSASAALANSTIVWVKNGAYDTNPISSNTPVNRLNRDMWGQIAATYCGIQPGDVEKYYNQYGKYPIRTLENNGDFVGGGSVGRFLWGCVPGSYVLEALIEYNGNEATGGSMSPQSITKNTTIKINSFSRTGHTFNGWSIIPNGPLKYSSGEPYLFSSFSLSDEGKCILYARWDPIIYTVTLDKQGGTGGTDYVSATFGSAMSPISIPNREGHTFGGYFSEENGKGTQYYTATGTSAHTYDRPNNTPLYAKWDAIVYTVSFDKQGGFGGPNSVRATFDSDMPDVAIPDREGHTFGGYFSELNGGGTQYYTATGTSAHAYDLPRNETLYAYWIINTYTVTFIDWDGTVLDTQTVEYGSAAQSPAPGNRVDYSYAGWDYPIDYITEEMTVTAQYSNENTRRVVFENWDGTFLKQQHVDYGLAASEPYSLPRRAGYTFTNWDGVFNHLIENITITAEFKINSGIEMVSASWHTMALQTDGSLWAWGQNSGGRLGTGDTVDQLTPARVMEDVSFITAGLDHSMAIKKDGSLWAWGSNSSGELGLGDTIERLTPEKVMENVSYVTSNHVGIGGYSMAIKTDGSLWAWGHNAFAGQLGVGNQDDQLTPIKIMDDVSFVSAGAYHTMVIKTDGSLWACGINLDGSLGTGNENSFLTHVKVMENVSSVSAGMSFTLAIKTDGSLWAWGNNSSGQLGNGNTTKQFSPVNVMDNASFVSAGLGHAIAIKTDGSLWTWGNNANGELGNDDNIARSIPTKVMEGVLSACTGGIHTIAVKSDNSLWAWGSNSLKQLGIGAGTTDSFSYPIPVHASVAEVKVLPVSAEIQTGGALQYIAEVSAFGNIDRTVNWSVSGNTSAETRIISYGVLYVAPDEMATSLLVQATSKADSSKTATSLVTVTERATVSTPMSNASSGVLLNGTKVSLSCATVGSTIRYTTDGTEPTESSAVYSGPITISASTTIKAKAFMNLMTPSATAVFSYIVKAAKPIASPAFGLVREGTAVQLSCATAGATIRYTTDGSEPIESSTVYMSPIIITEYTSIRAKAFLSGMEPSDTAVMAYGIMPPVIAPTADPVPTTVSSGIKVALSCETSGAMIRYTTNGEEPTENNTLYSAPISLSQTTTIKSKAFKMDMVPSETKTFSYTFKSTTPVAAPSPGLGAILSNSKVTLACTTPGTIIRYTTNGSEPTESSSIYSAPITVTAPTTIKAKAFKSGWEPSDTATFTYAVKVTTPSANVSSGSVSKGTNITLSCTTAGVTIRYTTNGTEPNASSAAYSSPITINGETTLKIKAFRDGFVSSDTATYKYDTKAGAPTAKPTSGTQVIIGDSVTLSCATSGATIRYTINGTDPSIGSTIYSSPITITTPVTIRAKAYRSDLDPSNTAVFIYPVAPKVAMPTASRTSGSTITCGDKVTLYGASGATIRYTTNGSEPTASSPIYSSPIMITASKPSTTIKAKAFKSGMSASDTASFTYNVGAPPSASLSLGKVSFKIPASVPLVGGNTFNLNLDKLPASIIYEDGIIRVGIGSSIGNGKNAYDAKSDFSKLKDLINGNSQTMLKSLSSSSPLLGIKPDCSIAAYFEGAFPLNGSPATLSGRIVLKVGAKGSLKWQTLIWVVPVVLTLEIGANVTFSGGGTLVNMKDLVPNAALSVVLPHLEFRVGVGIGIASIGGYASVDLKYYWNIINRYNRLWLEGKAGFYAYFVGFEYKTGDLLKGKGTWNIAEWYGSSSGSWMAMNSASFTSEMYDLDNYSLAPRNYLGAQSAWLGDTVTRTRSGDNLKVLQESVYNETAPLIAEANGKRVMVFLADDGTRDDMNRTTLMYSVYNANLDTWGAPRAIDDNGTADYYPDIASDGSNIYVTWHRSKKIFNNSTTLDDILAAAEIAVARFDCDTETFTDVAVLTDNDVLDTQPKVAVSGDKAVVAWVQNTNNDIFGINGKDNAVIARQFADDAWGETVTLAGGLGAVLDMDAGYLSGEARIAYITDNDNNLETLDDRSLIVVDLTGTVKSNPVNNALVSNPSFTTIDNEAVLSWYENKIVSDVDEDGDYYEYWEGGNIRYMTAGGQISSLFDEQDMPADNYKILSNSMGESAVIYPSSENEIGYISARMCYAGQWGKAFKLAETGDIVKYFDGVWEDDGGFALAFNNSKTAIIGEDDDAVLIEKNDLCVLKAAPAANVGLTAVFYDDEDVHLGQKLPVIAEIENTGGVRIASVTVNVNGEKAKDLTIIGGLLPSETATVEFELDISANMPEQTDFIISVELNNLEDTDLSDNFYTITLGYSNLVLNVEKEYNDDSTVTVLVNIDNDSDYATNATLFLRHGQPDGEIIDIVELGEISGRQSKNAEFCFDPQTITFDEEEYVEYYFEVISDKNELYIADNTDFVVIFDLNDGQKVDLARAALTWDIIKGDNTDPNDTIYSLDLPTEGLYGTSISWSTGDLPIDINTGIVTQPIYGAGDAVGILEATVSLNGIGDIVNFTLTIREETPYQNVKGQVRSYDPKNETIVELMQGGEVKYTTLIPAETSGIGQQTQTFEFSEGVAPGTYTLIITKPGHTSFTVQTIVVGEEDLDLTQDSREAVSLMTLRCGDINGDNMINNVDLAVLWLAANYNKSKGQAANPLCDLNGDGMINNADLAILWLAVNYNKGPIVIT